MPDQEGHVPVDYLPLAARAFWRAPRFNADELTSPGVVTVVHNGVLVQNHIALIGNSAHRAVGKYSPHGPGPIKLQDHGNPVRFRNIWIREL